MGSSRVLHKKTTQNSTPDASRLRQRPVAGGHDAPHELHAVCALVSSATELDLHRKPGAQLAELIRSTLRLEAAAIFDADLDEIYPAGEQDRARPHCPRRLHLCARPGAQDQTLHPGLLGKR